MEINPNVKKLCSPSSCNDIEFEKEKTYGVPENSVNTFKLKPLYKSAQEIANFLEASDNTTQNPGSLTSITSQKRKFRINSSKRNTVATSSGLDRRTSIDIKIN